MTDCAESQDGAEARATSVRQAPSIAAWAFAVLSASLSGAVIASMTESVLFRMDLLRLMTERMWLTYFSFSFINHAVVGLVGCGSICLAGLATTRLISGSRRWLQPGALAATGWLTAQVILWVLPGLVFAGVDPEQLPSGLSGLGVVVCAWIFLWVPVGLVCLRLSRTWAGRLAGTLGRLAVWPSLLFVVVAIGVLWPSRPAVQSAEGFWPIAPPRGSDHSSGPPRNVVLIVFDTLRVDRLGCYGYRRPTTPHIDAFAANSVVWDQAFSCSAWTLPSHASIFTGLHPSQHGAGYVPDPREEIRTLDDRFTTLAEVLRDRGYQTMALSNNDFVSPGTNLTKGFQSFASPMVMWYPLRSLTYPFYALFLRKSGLAGPLLGQWFARNPGGRETGQLAAQWLAGRDRSRPFFLFVNYMEAHLPYEPSRAYREQFVSAADKDRSYQIDQSDLGVWDYLFFGKKLIRKEDVRILSDLYDARVREVDDHFADLLRVIAAEADLDDTLVILTADHGENLGEHGLLEHQYCVYNTLVHVPLIVRWPRGPKPQRVNSLVQTCDIFPSVLQWAEAEYTSSIPWSARSLWDRARTPERGDPRLAYSEYLHWPSTEMARVGRLDPHFDPSRWTVSYRAVVDGTWKLILGSPDRLELYDLAGDPGECRNLAASNPSKAAELSKQVKRWLASLEPLDPNGPAGPRRPVLDSEQRKRLRDLGYVQ
jgi:arylsulfatase A-like enzyme